MRDGLFSLRGIDDGEKYIVSILLAQALFLGIFVGAFDISAHSLFLSVYDEKMLAVGYLVSGLTGLVLLSFYFSEQSNIKPSNFAFFVLLSVAIITLILWGILVLKPAGWVLFLVFIMLGPLNIISVMGLRTIAGTIYSRLRGSRLYAVTDSAFIAGIIIICLIIPVILLLGFRLQNVLLISGTSVLVSAILQAASAKRQRQSSESPADNSPGIRSTISVLNLFRVDRYSGMLGIFIVLSVVSAFFIQYSFLALTREKFPDAGEMAIFLALLTGVIMIFTLFGKLILFSYLLKNYGLRFCLAVTPALLSFFTVIAIAVGMVMGYTMETAGGFMIFFILLALIRFISRSMDDSLESTSFKILYQTLDEKVRYGVQSVMDSAAREAAAFLAGLVLAGIGVLGFVRLIHFSWILFLILGFWLWVAYRLYREYRTSLRKSIDALPEEKPAEINAKEPKVFLNRFYGERTFRLDYFNLVSGDFSQLEKIDNQYYFDKLLEHASVKHDINLTGALKKINKLVVKDDIRKKTSVILKKLGSPDNRPASNNERLITARKALADTRMPQTTDILRLLREKSAESKRYAIYLIGKFKLKDMLPEVCECMNIPGLESDTEVILRSFGQAASEELIRFYLVSAGNINASRSIIRLLSGLHGSEDTGFLFSRLWSNSRQLKEMALNGLLRSGFKPGDEDKIRLNQLISDIAGIITWNLSARRCLEKNNDNLLAKEINKEINRWSTFLLKILSLAYNPAAITRIRKNLEFETIESVHYAHAMIDIIMDDSVKAQIIYLLDVVPDDEKLRNLGRFFPVGIPDYYKLLEDILNRDYNLLSVWTKACVLRNMTGIRDPEMAESVIALLFSPEGILQEEAVRLIARTDIKLYRSVHSRIPYSVRRHLDTVVNGETDDRDLLYEKTRFLSGFMPGIAEEELAFPARKMLFGKDLKMMPESANNGYIVWGVEEGSKNDIAMISYSQGWDHAADKLTDKEFESFYVLPLKALEEFLDHYPDNTHEFMNFIENLIEI
jgi:hypothetical protein